MIIPDSEVVEHTTRYRHDDVIDIEQYVQMIAAEVGIPVDTIAEFKVTMSELHITVVDRYPATLNYTNTARHENGMRVYIPRAVHTYPLRWSKDD